jgi:hypothetical protein
MLGGFLPTKGSFCLVLTFHAAMLHGMMLLVQPFLG